MKGDELFKAIKKLKPTAEFSFNEDDYSTVKWDKLDGEAPSITEINQTILEIKKIETQAKTEKAAAKASAQAKLAALGLSADEVAAVVGN